MAELTDVRETVRERYAAAARTAADRQGGCCGGEPSCSPDGEQDVFGGALYDATETDGATGDALDASLGCGVPTAVADLRAGETVLDLGSGAGADVLISAQRVAPGGRAIGLDMTDEMLELARANAREAGVENVEFRKGYIEAMPLADASVDVVISNCVINLSGDKRAVLREAARVLRPGGRFAVSDVIADPDMDDRTRADMTAWTGCIAGALTEREFTEALRGRGLRGHRGPPHPPRARARRVGHRPRAQAVAPALGARRGSGHGGPLQQARAALPAEHRSATVQRITRRAGARGARLLEAQQALDLAQLRVDLLQAGRLPDQQVEAKVVADRHLVGHSPEIPLKLRVLLLEQAATLEQLGGAQQVGGGRSGGRRRGPSGAAGHGDRRPGALGRRPRGTILGRRQLREHPVDHAHPIVCPPPDPPPGGFLSLGGGGPGIAIFLGSFELFLK